MKRRLIAALRWCRFLHRLREAEMRSAWAVTALQALDQGVTICTHCGALVDVKQKHEAAVQLMQPPGQGKKPAVACARCVNKLRLAG